MNLNHDMHVHTPLSACYHQKGVTVDQILKTASENGIETLGFADHFWAKERPDASEWYRPQDMKHISRIREMIPEDTYGIEVLFGCESEYWGDGKCGMSPEAAAQLDFVLLPCSHLHMGDLILPKPDMNDREIGEFMVRIFNEALDLGLASGIPHPFVPCSFPDRVDSIIGGISDATFRECFSKAAEKQVSIEITTQCLPTIFAGEERDGHHDSTFIRVLSIAHECGCVFHLASDAHDLRMLGEVKKLEPFIREMGISEEKIRPFSKREV